MHSLSKRLALIAELVKSGSNVCDVGTDHGYLPAFLYLSGRCGSVTATDIKEKPLENARANLKRLGADGVKLILCDGLAGVCRSDADTVIIAGMGGEVISGIIDRAAWLRDNTVELILQPTTSAKQLREYLAYNGFCVEREQALSENGKIYSVMLARFTGKPYALSDAQALIGLLQADSDDACKYIEKQYKIIQKCARDLESVSQKRAEHKKYTKAAEMLKQILEGKNGI